MSYDPHFEQARLDQLAEQCLTKNTAKGNIIFLSDAEDNRPDVASWRFNDSDEMEGLIKGEFKVYIMNLMEVLMVYRAQHDQPNASQAVVHVDGNRLELKWVTREEAEALREVENQG